MMRVKNEARWIGSALASVGGLADGVVILDDGSTDGTADVCRTVPHVVRYEYQDEPVPDEYRDKQRLLGWCLELAPAWIMVLDGDEVLETRAPAVLRRAMADAEAAGLASLQARFLYLWDAPSQYIADEECWHPLLFPVRASERDRLRFAPDRAGARLHCGRVPAGVSGPSRKVDVAVKHFGYVDRADRRRKYEFYVRHDPARARAGYYEHLLRRRPRLARWHERSLADPVCEFPAEPAVAVAVSASAPRPVLPAAARRVLRRVRYRLWR
jgi:glycosyltransferase involved in cell wall biosynthesis